MTKSERQDLLAYAEWRRDYLFADQPAAALRGAEFLRQFFYWDDLDENWPHTAESMAYGNPDRPKRKAGTGEGR